MHLIFLLSLSNVDIFTLKTWHFYSIRCYSYCSRLINYTNCSCKSWTTACLAYNLALQSTFCANFIMWRQKIIKIAWPVLLQLSTLSSLKEEYHWKLVEYCNRLLTTIFWRQNRNHIGWTTLSHVFILFPNFVTCVDPTVRWNWKGFATYYNALKTLNFLQHCP